MKWPREHGRRPNTTVPAMPPRAHTRRNFTFDVVQIFKGTFQVKVKVTRYFIPLNVALIL